MTAAANSQVLAIGARVLWYEIEAILGQGGFGITYRAHDRNLDRTVAIKEYLPAMFATRGADGIIAPTGSDQKADYEWGLARFIDEGRTLARFDHPGIVRVFSVFEANGTAYLVMRFEEGAPLDSLLKRTLTLPEPQLRKILSDVMDGLTPVHEAGFIHRDIKPANIYIREDGSAVLIDFGSARQALGIQTQTLTTLVSPGYAPFEQYSSDGAQQGPWTDIYALGATAYRAMTGRAPVTAVDRSRALLTSTADQTLEALGSLGSYSRTLVSAIERAVAFHERDRPQSIAAWRACFGAGSDTAPTKIAQAAASPAVDQDHETTEAATERRYDEPTEIIADTEILPRPTEPASSRSRRKKLVTAGVAIALALLVLWRPWRGSSGLPEPAERLTTVQAASAALASPRKPGGEPEPVNGTTATNIDPAIKTLLGAARAHVVAGRLTRPPGGNALENFQAVLDRDPFNDDAQAGIEAIVQDRLRHARQAIDEKDYTLARAYTDAAAAADPAHLDVLETRAELPARNDAPATVASAPATAAPPTSPTPSATETIIGAATKLAEPATQRQLRRAQKSLQRQDYRKAFKQLKKNFD